MAALGSLIWAVRRGSFGTVPKVFRLLSGFMFLFFVLFAAIDLIAWPSALMKNDQLVRARSIRM